MIKPTVFKQQLAESWHYYVENSMALLIGSSIEPTASAIETVKQEATRAAQAEFNYAGTDREKALSWRSHYQNCVIGYARSGAVINAFGLARTAALELSLAEADFSESIKQEE